MSKKIISDTNKLIAEYNKGKSASELASQYNTSIGVITGTLKRAGVTLRSLSDSAKKRIQKHGYKPIVYTEEVRAKMRANHADVSGKNNPNFKGNGKQTEDGVWLTYDANGYLRRWLPEHPLANDGYVGEHVYQACLKYGADQVAGRDVHHKNKKKDDNSWDNLDVITRAEHRRIEFNLNSNTIE